MSDSQQPIFDPAFLRTSSNSFSSPCIRLDSVVLNNPSYSAKPLRNPWRWRFVEIASNAQFGRMSDFVDQVLGMIIDGRKLEPTPGRPCLPLRMGRCKIWNPCEIASIVFLGAALE